MPNDVKAIVLYRQYRLRQDGSNHGSRKLTEHIMTNGVCTYALYQSISNDAWSVQKKLAEAEEQESTGLKGTDYGTYGSSSGQLMTLQNAVNKLNTWNTNTKTAASRTSSMYTAISNIITEMTTLKTSISSAISGTDTTTTLNDTASGILDDVVDRSTGRRA